MKAAKAAFILLVPTILIFPSYAQSSEVLDAAGDATPASVDIIKAKITQQVGSQTLYFMGELAGLPPPALPAGALTVNYVWALNTLPSIPPCTLLAGNPMEYFVEVRWNGTSWIGILLDRSACTPESPFPVSSSIEPRVSGATVKTSLGLDMLGNPSSIQWRSVTSYLFPGTVITVQDRAPDLGLPLATLTIK